MRKLYRSRDNKMFTGLCGGLGELTNVDATLYRILLVVLTILSSGVFIVLYLIVSMVVPKTPELHNPFGHYHRPYGGNPYGYQDPMNQRPHHNGHWNHGTPPYTPHQPQGQPTYQPQAPQPPHQAPQAPSASEQMMDDLEKKALRREIEELKAKLSEKEKGE
ncbi:hypothetical protein J40TS1_28550 [Paenibacillus montaniterrae]|uniref:Phage shock protein PspC N-terminal domain-containing protein n=1 Tax=Paenibacillus montaniterrae TaxID=429341 RepID=A0A920CZ92_9BACL|nr:hypothetical protein J40TS1_28550 [Paenibacillus montaniterrae]